MTLRRKPYKKTVLGRVKNYARTQTRGPEIKRVDLIPIGGYYQSLTQVISLTTAIFGLNIPVIGTADYQRIGNRVKGHSISLKGYIYNNGTSASGATDDLARFVIVYDKFSNGTAPTWADIFTGVDANGVNANTPTVLHRNDTKLDRFIVLRDHLVALPRTSTAGDLSIKATTQLYSDQTVIDWYIPLKGLVTEYIANNGSQSDIGSGGIYLLYQSWVNSSTNSPWVFAGSSRFQYIDN